MRERGRTEISWFWVCAVASYLASVSEPWVQKPEPEFKGRQFLLKILRYLRTQSRLALNWQKSPPVALAHDHRQGEILPDSGSSEKACWLFHLSIPLLPKINKTGQPVKR